MNASITGGSSQNGALSLEAAVIVIVISNIPGSILVSLPLRFLVLHAVSWTDHTG